MKRNELLLLKSIYEDYKLEEDPPFEKWFYKTIHGYRGRGVLNILLKKDRTGAKVLYNESSTDSRVTDVGEKKMNTYLSGLNQEDNTEVNEEEIYEPTEEEKLSWLRSNAPFRLYTNDAIYGNTYYVLNGELLPDDWINSIKFKDVKAPDDAQGEYSFMNVKIDVTVPTDLVWWVEQ